MMLACDFIKEPIEFSENKINILIIENQQLFRNVVQNFINQSEGRDEKYILSEGLDIIEFSKKGIVISDVFNIDFSSKKLLSKLNQHICENFTDSEKLYKLFSFLNETAFDAVSSVDYDLQFNEIENFESIVKIFDFHIDNDEMGLPEKVIEFMKIQRAFFKKELFVFVNLKSCFSKEETQNFYKWISYNKFKVIFLESFQREKVDEKEKNIIIDKDLSEIC